MTVWTDPKNWERGKLVTAGNLNQNIRDNQLHLRERNIVIHDLPQTANILTTSTTPVHPVAESKLTIETMGNDVLVMLMATVYNLVDNQYCYFDFWVDDSYYISSLTDTALSDGLWRNSTDSDNVRPVVLRHLLTNLVAGTHTFEFRMWTSATGTAAIYMANSECQISLEETGGLTKP